MLLCIYTDVNDWKITLDKSESSWQKNTREEILFFNKVSNAIEVFCLFLIVIPFIFISGYPLVFFGSSVILFVFAMLLVFFGESFGKELYLKSFIALCMGATIGLIQLSPVPSLCIFILFLLTAHKLFFSDKIIVFLIFCLVALVSFFICNDHLEFKFLLSAHNVLIDLTAVISLFLGMLVYFFTQHLKYKLLKSNYEQSKNRYEHFVSLANKLARYAPAPVWQKVVQEKTDASLGNKRRKLSVFFSDIKGFTDLSDTLSAEDLTEFLNNYFESMSKIAKKHGGTIDKFIGDALMVFFGDPDSKGEREDAIACVEMALDMNRELARLRNYWSTMGFSGLHVRMGINTGYCHVGNFGSATRLSYTAIGREVNMSARIQAAAKPNRILISDETHQLVKHRFLCQEGEEINLKGFTKPVKVWEVRRHRQGDEIKDAQWLDHDMPGFNLHLNMMSMKEMDKESIRNMLIKAGRIVDASIKKDQNLL